MRTHCSATERYWRSSKSVVIEYTGIFALYFYTGTVDARVFFARYAHRRYPVDRYRIYTDFETRFPTRVNAYLIRFFCTEYTRAMCYARTMTNRRLHRRDFVAKYRGQRSYNQQAVQRPN